MDELRAAFAQTGSGFDFSIARRRRAE